MDVEDEELLIPSDNEESVSWKARAVEISTNFTRIGITLLVLGMLATVMGIISVFAARGDIDQAAEGVWCGILVLICGGLCIASRYSLHFELVMASFIMNVISAVLLMFGVIFAAISTFQYADGYSVESLILFALGVNVWLCACFPICIYLSIVYYKILKHNKQNYCYCDCYSEYIREESSGYRLVHVPVQTENATGL